MSPNTSRRQGWVRGTNQPSIDDDFFKKTAPQGKWVWWTVAQDPDLPGERYEYIYMDALTGNSISHCAEPSGPRSAVVAVPVPCAPPAKGR